MNSQGLGNVLKMERQRQKKNTEYIAYKLGLSNTTITKIESGKVKPSPRISDIVNYADELGLTFTEVLLRAGIIKQKDLKIKVMDSIKSKAKKMDGYFISEQDFLSLATTEEDENKVSDFSSFFKVKNLS